MLDGEEKKQARCFSSGAADTGVTLQDSGMPLKQTKQAKFSQIFCHVKKKKPI